jgi:TonB-dependent receptor
MNPKIPLILLALSLGAAPLAAQSSTASSTVAVGASTLTGSVTNLATGDGLVGALVEIPSLGRSVLVDGTGRYVITDVPAGEHELVVSYAGLDTARARVRIDAGLRTSQDFELTSGIYTLEPYRVAGEREGNAAAITQQRNSPSLRNVTAMDTYGNLPNLDATELVIRMPGVTMGAPGEELVESISVRGTGPAMTTINVDGGLISNIGAQSRQNRMSLYTGGSFESVEVIKGLTPDTGAESLGGTVNLKTRSPLNMREKRRITYLVSAAWAPPFTDQIPLREKHRVHPLINVSYQEKFKVFGSEEENLAVAVNVFYNQNAIGFSRTNYDYQQTNTSPAFMWDYRTMDNYNNRRQESVSTKVEYRLSPHSLVRMNVALNDGTEPERRQYETRAFAGNQSTVPNATSTGVVPGWTEYVTTVRAVPTPANATAATTPAAAIDVTSRVISRSQKLRHVDFAGEHTYGRWDLDWAAVWSRSRRLVLPDETALTHRIGGVPVIGPNGQAGSATNNLRGPNGETGVGWILDRSGSDSSPRFLQNGGLDFTNPDYYRPTQNGLTTTAGDLLEHLVKDIRGNARYRLPIDRFTAYLKSGFDLREQTLTNWNIDRHRWSYIGTATLPTVDVLLSDKVQSGRDIPVWDAAMFYADGQLIDPSLWREDRYYHESNKYLGYNTTRELVTAAYIMTQGRVGKNGFLAGVRGERTDTKAEAYVRSRSLSTTAQREADPQGSAERDYASNLRMIDGDYTEYFPSVHLWRDFTPNLKVRASYSTSFGRPPMNNALPVETPNENNQTLSVGNPALGPQRAKNWDLSLEYYFEPAGSLSVAWFHKTIRDYIVTGREVGVIGTGPDNGYGGEYAGFTLRSTANAGTAVVQGWEFSYLQQLRFLPGPLSGLSLNANYTLLNTHGDFGSNEYRTNGQIVGFIPRSANVSLSWNYKRFGTRVLYNYTSENLRAYGNTQRSRDQYMLPRELVNLGLTWRLNPNATFQIDIANLFNEPLHYYRGISSQTQQYLLQGMKVSAGIQGRF